MQLKDNKLASLRRYYFERLSGDFTDGEIQAMFLTAAEHYLGWSRTEIIRRLNENINQSDVLLLYDCAKALARHEPLQYILGKAWFMDMYLSVNSNVLIPRPETEELVRLLLATFTATTARVLDIGTGSGCIALAIKQARPAYEVDACDISAKAIEIARDNSRLTGNEIRVFCADAMNNDLPPGKYDVIVSNPPYVMPEESVSMSRNVLDHEPHLALFAPPGQPLIYYKKIVEISRQSLASGGMLFFELNPQTAEEALAEVKRSGNFSSCAIGHDLSGKKRFLYARK